MAPPAIPITIIAEPILVNLPKWLMPSGKIAGHMSELAKPNKATKITANQLEMARDKMVKIIPKMAHILRAFC